MNWARASATAAATGSNDRTARASSVSPKPKVAKSGRVERVFGLAATRTCGNWLAGGSSSIAASTSGGSLWNCWSSSALSFPSLSVSSRANSSAEIPISRGDSFPSRSRSYRRTSRAPNKGPFPSTRRLLTVGSGRSGRPGRTATAIMAVSAGLRLRTMPISASCCLMSWAASRVLSRAVLT